MITGRIYKICSHQTNKIYVGSTTQSLQERFSGHKCHYKQYINNNGHYVTSFEIIKFDDAYICLIEEVVVTNKHELHKLERKYIESIPEIVNRVHPTRTVKEHYQANKKQINNKRKQKYVYTLTPEARQKTFYRKIFSKQYHKICYFVRYIEFCMEYIQKIEVRMHELKQQFNY